MSAYQTDRQWSDQFIPAICAIVGPHLLVPSSVEVDTKEAADLVVLRARDMTIAARVRRPGYADSFPFEFTIRSSRPSHAKTEMTKLMEGWGDWMLYAHAAAAPGQLQRWWLIDLHQWRQRLLRAGYEGGWGRYATKQSNRDGTCFLAFDLRAFVPTVLIAGSHALASLADPGAVGLDEDEDDWVRQYEHAQGAAA